VGFGLATLVWPRHSALALLALFGGYALFDGLTVLVIAASAGRPRLWPTLGGAVSVVAGLLAFARPRLLALMLIAVLGGWLVVRGLIELFGEASVSVDADSPLWRRRRWSVYLNGAMSAAFGAGLIAAPKLGALSLMWAIGAWAVLHGLLMAAFALSLRPSKSAAATPLSAGSGAPS
jgi:uncharacterized membrane protein HdeD (DUF308 family)